MASVFSENVIDIVDNWGNYPATVPACGGTDFKIGPNGPAYNSGHVHLKCFINHTCPFSKTPLKEDTLTFNKDTFVEIAPQLPERVTSVITATDGVEGIHFRPRIRRSSLVASKYLPF